MRQRVSALRRGSPAKQAHPRDIQVSAPERRANESRVVLAGRGELTMVLPKSHVIVSTVLQLVAAGILLQTLFFKFTGAAESVYIFTTLGLEPWGRVSSGIAELVAATLLLYPPTAAFGGILAMGVMAGAIASHLTLLGIEVQGDGGLLFALALIVFAAGAAITVIRRAQLLEAGRALGVAI